MKKERKELEVSLLDLNTGQIDWLPANPRQWTREDLDKTTESIKRDPDFLEDRPILVLPIEKGKYCVFAGNLRSRACLEAKRKTAPCIIYHVENDEDRETIKRRAILDNGSFGAWDFDALANEWDDLPLGDWGVPAWGTEEVVNIDEFGTEFSLPEGDKAPFQQMTFSLADEQANIIKDAIAAIKKTAEFDFCETFGNENSNGNALYLIIQQWASARK